jgi:hypothetical protein
VRTSYGCGCQSSLAVPERMISGGDEDSVFLVAEDCLEGIPNCFGIVGNCWPTDSNLSRQWLGLEEGEVRGLCATGGTGSSVKGLCSLGVDSARCPTF